jgi:hypothetical protein
MGFNWRILAIGALLMSCKPVDTSVSHRDILDDYKALNIRVDELSHPLLAGNHDICDQTVDDNGIRWHQLDDYPEDLQPVAQSYWNVSNERSVFYVLLESAADEAGIKSGDRPSEAVINKITGEKAICRYAVLVSYIDEINAYATGNEIIVTSGMLRSITDDQYLTLVLAHEISHNILDHIADPDGDELETQADEAAIKLMARAGLDFEEAIRRREAHQIKSANGESLSEFESERIAMFKTYSQSVKTRQEKGEPLWP